MKMREIKKNIFKGGAIDWDRRLFDSLIPLPDGTSYNAYLIKGSEKTVLLDSVDPAMTHILLEQLKTVSHLDYIISHHAEQDHSGSIPVLIEKYPGAKVIASEKGKGMLVDHLCIPEDKIIAFKDGETLSLGDRTIKVISTPWVHWPETISTYIPEDEILFSCDFFGSHLATSELYVDDTSQVYEAAKRYYAEIMMPFRTIIKKNLEKLSGYSIKMIAPSHGPVYNEPDFIIDAYKDWISDKVKNLVVIPYVSMHGSTQRMVEYINHSLAEKNIEVRQFNLPVTDLGKLAISLVDAATIIIGTPTVHVGPHPVALNAANLTNALRPKLQFASIIGSYGWNSKMVEKISDMIPNLKVEILEPVLCRGYPREQDFDKLENLARSIETRHKQLNIL
ncbi:MAG: FprA family A-type flavoprotein [Spirochaetales bacterium]|nr:FprA family A-type flavoprotein [Spirochaetales bacterium]